MKIIGIDIESRSDRSARFFDAAEKILDIEIIRVPLIDIKKNFDGRLVYENFSHAGLTLENYAMKCPAYWTKDKPFVHALFSRYQYSTTNLEYLKEQQQFSNKNFIAFQHAKSDVESDWVFGNVISMVKWSSSLFKLKPEWLTDRNFVKDTTDVNYAIWYATRIGLDVHGF